jgi:dimethylargininase
MSFSSLITSRALVRPPAANFAAGLTTVDLGVPDLACTLVQHEAYCQALEQCGVMLLRLPPDEQHPDSTFVEDTAIITDRGAILTRPGAVSRAREVPAIAAALSEFFPSAPAIAAPGTVDGGDVCEAGEHFFIGLSHRTNESGAQQLATALGGLGFTTSCVDIRGIGNILHLKSGLAWLGNNRLVVIDALADCEEFAEYERVSVKPGEEYAANCVLINDRILFASGYPDLQGRLEQLGYRTVVLEMSEFQKMDGGLSCLSLRF